MIFLLGPAADVYRWSPAEAREIKQEKSPEVHRFLEADLASSFVLK